MTCAPGFGLTAPEMGQLVGTGSMAKCSFGLAPGTLVALPTKRVMVEGVPVLTATDVAPGLNIVPFGMCTSMANPTVAAATSAALGVLTPMPCVPAVAGQWIATTPTAAAGSMGVVTSASMCTCSYGGVITVTKASAIKSNGKP